MHWPPRVDPGLDERGATATEYGLLLSLIALAIIGSVFVLGTSLGGLYGRTCDDVSMATTGTNC
jgi:pilus assembly protein Flp/PilA